MSSTIRNYLLDKAEHQCEKCGWHEINPVTGLTPLEIHHIDGNYLNSSIDNLQVLCPNCHSLTPNFRSLNENSNRIRTQSRKYYCINCGKEISPGSNRCKECNNLHRRQAVPVERDELKQLIRKLPFVQIAKMYNVTDNAIKKWCIKYGLPSKRKQINKISDEDWDLL